MKSLPCGKRLEKAKNHGKNSNLKDDVWLDTLNAFLKKQGLRSTKQRDLVAKIAMNHEEHFEIQSLIREVQAVDRTISPATVYRSVRTLTDAGLLTELIQTQTGVSLYEPKDAEHHDHLICLDCGHVFEFHDEELEFLQQKIAKKRGFEIESHHHVLYAHCELLEGKSKKK